MKLLYLCGLLLMSFSGGNKGETIQGVVVGKNDLPVSKVYVFVVKGEEETITATGYQ